MIPNVLIKWNWSWNLETLVLLVFCYFKYQYYKSTDLYTSVAEGLLRSDAHPDTTVIRQELNTGPLVWETNAPPIAP